LKPGELPLRQEARSRIAFIFQVVREAAILWLRLLVAFIFKAGVIHEKKKEYT
jgi:hypothetical protein